MQGYLIDAKKHCRKSATAFTLEYNLVTWLHLNTYIFRCCLNANSNTNMLIGNWVTSFRTPLFNLADLLVWIVKRYQKSSSSTFENESIYLGVQLVFTIIEEARKYDGLEYGGLINTYHLWRSIFSICTKMSKIDCFIRSHHEIPIQQSWGNNTVW